MNPTPCFHFLTLFPETIEVWLRSSIIGRAHEAGLFAFQLYQLRDYTVNRHRTVDDVAYGGGGGMVLKIEPLVAAVEAILAKTGRAATQILSFSPAGTPLNQALIGDLGQSVTAGIHHFVLVCGHYEGIDQRFIENWVDREVSLGDFVLTGGELPAVALTDAFVRQLEGALGNATGAESESFRITDPKTGASLLEYPHYTRPADFRGHRVPEVLLNGNHAAIARWREDKAIQRTVITRPELLESAKTKFVPLPEIRL